MAEYHRCHRDWLSAVAPSLAGELIFPFVAPDACVDFAFERRRGGYGKDEILMVVLSLRNELSEESAGTLLHFMRHVDEELYFDRPHFRTRLRPAQIESFSPAVLSAFLNAGRYQSMRRGGSGNWIRALKDDDLLLPGIDDRPAKLRDVMVVGKAAVGLSVNPNANTPPGYIDDIIHFIGQCGQCVGRKLKVELSMRTCSDALGFFERLVKEVRVSEEF